MTELSPVVELTLGLIFTITLECILIAIAEHINR